MIFADSKRRFSNRATDYARYRPRYPAAVLDTLRAECGLRSDHVIADVGSGTGLLSELFLKNGNCVFGVEPNQEMRMHGEEYLQAYRRFTSVSGAAEATTLPDACVDFVTVGQAFHWFDHAATRREFCRVLKTRGWVLIAWNEHRTEESELTSECEQLLERFGIDYRRVKDACPEFEHFHTFFGGDRFVSRELLNEQSLDWEGLHGLMRSNSFAPAEGHPNYCPMMKELERIYREHQGDRRVRIQYWTHICFGQLQPAGN